jgi:DNA-binding MarR family transcriptional regulator
MNFTADHQRAYELRMLLKIISKVSFQSFEQHLQSAGVNINGLQFGIIRVLQHQPMTISELSRKFTLDPSTLVPVVDVLVKRGIVARGQDPADRRRMPLSLTDDGLALVQDITPIGRDDVMATTLAQLGEERSTELLGLLRELLRHLPNGEATLADIQTRVISENADSWCQRWQPADTTDDQSLSDQKRLDS